MRKAIRRLVNQQMPSSVQSDINMLALLAAMERSQKQWHELLGFVGLEITKIWTPEGGPESVIEAVLP